MLHLALSRGAVSDWSGPLSHFSALPTDMRDELGFPDWSDHSQKQKR
jgi:hypothetical protein